MNYIELADLLTAKGNAMMRLQSILEEERTYILELKTDELNESTSRKEAVTAEIGELKERLRKALSLSFRDFGLPGDICLTPLIDKMKGSEKERLSTLQKTLLSASGNVEELLQGNADLLENSLRMVGTSMNFFKRVLSRSDTYGNAGHMMEVPASSRLVCKEI